MIVKTARCHATYELDGWTPGDPEYVEVVPLQNLSQQQRMDLESTSTSCTGWSEFGSRMFEREIISVTSGSGDLRNGWVVAQERVYRHAVITDGDMLVVRSCNS